MNRLYRVRIFGETVLIGWFGGGKWNKKLQIIY